MWRAIDGRQRLDISRHCRAIVLALSRSILDDESHRTPGRSAVRQFARRKEGGASSSDRTDGLLVIRRRDEPLPEAYALRSALRMLSTDQPPAPHSIKTHIPPDIARSFSKCRSSLRLAKLV